MPAYVLIVGLFGLVLAIIGFTMAFRQTAIRRYLGRPVRPPPHLREPNDNEDPFTYILRIAGVMVMIFGIVIGGMVTLINLA
jgi:hypothetical protein